MRKLLLALLILLIPSIVAVTVYYLVTKKIPTNRDAVGDVATLAGAGRPGVEDGKPSEATFSDPFGVAVDKRGNVIIADAGQSNRIRIITAKGNVELLAGSDEGYKDGVCAQRVGELLKKSPARCRFAEQAVMPCGQGRG